MTYRTDVTYRDGKLAVRPSTQADTRQPLPEVKATDRLGSDKWGESLKTQAGAMGDDSVLNSAAIVHNRMVEGFRSLVAQRNAQDPAITQLQHLRQVERNFNGLVSTAAKQSDSTRAKIKERIGTVKSEFESSLKFTSRDAAEIRGMLRSMPESDRNKFLSEAIEAGDGNIMGAVFDGHPSLSGINKDRASAYYDQAMQKHSPEALKLVRALGKADSLLFESFSDLLVSDGAITAKAVREKHEAASKEAMEAADRAQQRHQDQWTQ